MTSSESNGSSQSSAASNGSLTGSALPYVVALAPTLPSVVKSGASVAKSAIDQRGLTRRAEIRAQTQRPQQSTPPRSSD